MTCRTPIPPQPPRGSVRAGCAGPTPRPAGWAVLAALALMAGCGEENPSGPGRIPGVLRIPIPYAFEEAAAMAIPGDTLLVLLAPLPLSQTVTFRPDQTPLLVRGTKNYPVLSGPVGSAILRFDRPRAGTRVEQMGLSGGTSAIRITGAGALTVHDARFVGGEVQVSGSGSGLTVDVTETILRDAGTFSLEATAGTTLFASRCTIVRAGDCGVLLSDGASGTVTRSILWESTNYGIACLNGSALADTSGCNDVHLSGVAPYSGCAAPATDFSLDPRFCDPDREIYSLVSDSPCAPDSSLGCGLIGTLPVGCDP